MQNPQDTDTAIFRDIHDNEREPRHHQFALFFCTPGFYTRQRVFLKDVNHTGELVIRRAGYL